MDLYIIFYLCICFLMVRTGSMSLTDDEALSDEIHYKDSHEHNTKYDHEAFLGKEQAKIFDELSPEESKERLGKIFDNVDKNNDGYITDRELRHWIKFTHIPILVNSSKRYMGYYDADKDDHVSWTELVTYLYDYYTGLGYSVTKEEFNAKNRKRKFSHADIDKDDKLTLEELTAFHHPTYFDQMKDHILQLKLAEFDKDGDGIITKKEYAEFPWLGEQQFLFHTHDFNKDDKLDSEEILEWMTMSDHVTLEAEHLIKEADQNKDKMLTKEEMLGRHDVFVGSKTKHKDVDGLLGHSHRFRNEL